MHATPIAPPRPGARMSWFDLSRVAAGARVVFADAWDIFPECIIPEGTEAVILENGLNDIWGGILVTPGDQALRDKLAHWEGCVHLGSHLNPAGAEDDPQWHEQCPLVLAPEHADTRYVMVLDVWSNPTFTGPFANEAAALAYIRTLNPAFNCSVMTGDAMRENMAEFGETPIVKP